MSATASKRGFSLAAQSSRTGALSRAVSLPILLVAVAATGFGGFVVTSPEASANAVAGAGADLTHLLRAMAGLKMSMAGGMIAAVAWRLGAGVGPGWLAAYVIACSAMAAGPGMIWDMAHVGAGALLLHGGLLAGLLLLWRDPVVGNRLAAAIAARRTRVNQAGG